jgi:MFS family permease
MFFNFSLMLTTPVLSPYLRFLGYSEIGVSLILSAYPISLILLSPILGTLSDRWGRRPVIHLGFLAFISSLGLYLINGHWVLLVLARTLEAVAVAAVLLVVLARLEDSFSNKNRGQMMGLNFSFNHLMKLAAPIMAGVLADYFFLRAPFIAALIIAAVFLIVWVIVGRDHPQSTQKLLHHGVSYSVFNIFAELKEFIYFRQLRAIAILGASVHAAQSARLI